MLDLHHILKYDNAPEGTVEALKEFWDRALFQPWQEIGARPSKEIRGKMVELGWHLAGCPALPSENLLSKISHIIETLHLGSLIVDDIQDDSLERRGLPTLHRIHGLALALNLGNFLYFQALNFVSQLKINEAYQHAAAQKIAETLRDAHLGQALDVSVAIDQVQRAKIPKLVETSLRLKSGALMKLSVQLGALLNPEFKNWSALDSFGEAFGSCLQKLDDVGNFTIDGSLEKHLEDLKLRRPTWIWSVLAQTGSDQDWLDFNSAIKALPSLDLLRQFIKTSPLKDTAFKMAVQDLEKVLTDLKTHFSLQDSCPAFVLTSQLTARLTNAY